MAEAQNQKPSARERRLQGLPHWDEIEIRLRHRWTPIKVLKWHREMWPKEHPPAERTLFRYLEDQPESWFVNTLLVAQAGRPALSRVLVLERQAELIEFMAERMAAARGVEATFNGIPMPQVDRMVETTARLLNDHLRASQELGLVPKFGAIGSGKAEIDHGTGDSNTPELARLLDNLLNLPEGEFVPTMVSLIGPPPVKQPLNLGEAHVIETRPLTEEEREGA